MQLLELPFVCVKMRLRTFQFQKVFRSDTLGTPLPGGGDPYRTLPQHGLRPCTGAQEPRMLRLPRIKNPPQIWAGYGPVKWTFVSLKTDLPLQAQMTMKHT